MSIKVRIDRLWDRVFSFKVDDAAGEDMLRLPVVVENTSNELGENIPLSVVNNEKVYLLLQQIRDAIAMRPDYVEASNAQNVTGSVAIGSGTITTVTGQTNIGGYSADMIAENNSYTDWALSIRSRIS